MVAGADGEAVRFAYGWYGKDAQREIQIANHAADDCGLLPVFFSEDGNVGLEDIEEFGDYGADALEMSRARPAAKTAGKFTFVDEDGGIVAVNFLGQRPKKQVRASLAGECVIFANWARISREVFAG